MSQAFASELSLVVAYNYVYIDIKKIVFSIFSSYGHEMQFPSRVEQYNIEIYSWIRGMKFALLICIRMFTISLHRTECRTNSCSAWKMQFPGKWESCKSWNEAEFQVHRDEDGVVLSVKVQESSCSFSSKWMQFIESSRNSFYLHSIAPIII